MWVALQNALSRVVSVLQQFVLAWLLAKSDYGLIGLAYTVQAFANLLSNPGIDSVLIQRQRRFHLWSNPSFWLGLVTGLGGMLLMIVAAPIAAWMYGRPALIGLLAVMAIASPLQTLQIVPKARLLSQLHFRTVMSLGLLNNVLTMALTVTFAWLGYGAYSFAIPLPLTSAIIAAIYWQVARPRVGWNPQLRRWKYLFDDSFLLAGTKTMNTLVGQGDYIVLGLARIPEASIGAYVFAYSIAIQAFRLLAASAESVLFPSFTKLELNPALQLRSTFRATRLLALITVPLCALQILLARPLFNLFLPPRWLEAIPALQILSLGVMINVPSWPAGSLMMAQRRFGDFFRASLRYGLIFFATVIAAVWMHRSIEAVAVAVLLVYVWGSPYAYWVGVGPQQPYSIYFQQIYRPLAGGAISALLCLPLLWMLGSSFAGGVAAVVTVPVVFIATYTCWLAKCVASDFHDLCRQLAPFLVRIKLLRSGGAAPDAPSETIA